MSHSVSKKSPFSRIAGLVGGIGRAAFEFVYPPHCLLCHHEIPGRQGDGQTSLCQPCHEKLACADGNVCHRCGAPVGPFTVAVKDCLVCRRENFAFDEVIRLGLYRDELRIACLMAKNPGGALICQTLTDLLLKACRQAFELTKFNAVIPVPEHWLKRIVRSHYAAETIARRISGRLNVRLSTGILAKTRWTPKQAKSSPVQRRQQQKTAFHVADRIQLRGQTILLVDDILTTGATADAAARLLKRAGAERVVVAVVAVSPPSV